MDLVTSAQGGYVIRPPRQARSKASWRRILDAGRALIEEGGTQALTLSALCERADVAPTTVYQRVESMNGLLYAIFNDHMAEVESLNLGQLDRVLALPPRSPERIAAAIEAVGASFIRDQNLLRAITEYSASDDAFWQSENESANHFVEGIVTAFSFGDDQTALECANYIFTENMVRTIFGSHWMGNTNESYEDFKSRIFRMVWARLNSTAS